MNADGEALIPIREYARIFKRSLRACQIRAKSGKWAQAEKIDGRWYVYVPIRRYRAAREAAA